MTASVMTRPGRLGPVAAVLTAAVLAAVLAACSSGFPNPRPAEGLGTAAANLSSSASTSSTPVTSATASLQSTAGATGGAPTGAETATPLDPSSMWLLVQAGHLELVREDGTGRHVAAPTVDVAGRFHEVGLADWSPDGARFAFTEVIRGTQPTDPPESHLWIARSDGSGARKVFECGTACTIRFAPAWSPDGKGLAFVWGRFDEARGVWASGGVAVGDLATGRTRTVFESTASSDGVDRVRWSGDGHRLLLSMNEASSNKADSVLVSHRVAVVNTSGPPSQRPRTLTPKSADAGFADWNHRTGRIVYATNLLEQQGKAPSKDANVYTMAADGSDVHAVTHLAGAHGWGTQPAWTPDGRIVFVNCLSPGVCYVAFVDADGSHLQLPQQVTGEAPLVRPRRM